MHGIGRREGIGISGLLEPVSHYTDAARAGGPGFVSGCWAGGDAYREAAGLDPGRVKAYLGLGLVLRRQRRSPEAEAIFRQAILLNPQGASAHVELGGALFEQARYPEAAAAFRDAIRF